ncbi:hypothetical protein NDU88_002365 [Pleurodeles waltl]|uniref:Uncharacterized protein n=1 Tax=Pleurodeles waltl TaxID=8319 RepID=A0AAV7RBR8_PLEWA|nr:hypothetical protein NDU88_002365 [Pleurodeles waltl]
MNGPKKYQVSGWDASGNPPDKRDENAKARGTETAEKIAQTLTDHEEPKWRPPPGLESAGPRTYGKGTESLTRTGGTSPHPWTVPATTLRFCRVWRGGETVRRRLEGDAPEEPECERTPPGGLLTLREPLLPHRARYGGEGTEDGGEPKQ